MLGCTDGVEVSVTVSICGTVLPSVSPALVSDTTSDISVPSACSFLCSGTPLFSGLLHSTECKDNSSESVFVTASLETVSAATPLSSICVCEVCANGMSTIDEASSLLPSSVSFSISFLAVLVTRLAVTAAGVVVCNLEYWPNPPSPPRSFKSLPCASMLSAVDSKISKNAKKTSSVVSLSTAIKRSQSSLFLMALPTWRCIAFCFTSWRTTWSSFTFERIEC